MTQREGCTSSQSYASTIFARESSVSARSAYLLSVLRAGAAFLSSLSIRATAASGVTNCVLASVATEELERTLECFDDFDICRMSGQCSNEKAMSGGQLTVLTFAFKDFLVVLHESDLRLHAGEMSVS